MMELRIGKVKEAIPDGTAFMDWGWDSSPGPADFRALFSVTGPASYTFPLGNTRAEEHRTPAECLNNLLRGSMALRQKVGALESGSLMYSSSNPSSDAYHPAKCWSLRFSRDKRVMMAAASQSLKGSNKINMEKLLAWWLLYYRDSRIVLLSYLW